MQMLPIKCCKNTTVLVFQFHRSQEFCLTCMKQSNNFSVTSLAPLLDPNFFLVAALNPQTRGIHCLQNQRQWTGVEFKFSDICCASDVVAIPSVGNQKLVWLVGRMIIWYDEELATIKIVTNGHAQFQSMVLASASTKSRRSENVSSNSFSICGQKQAYMLRISTSPFHHPNLINILAVLKLFHACLVLITFKLVHGLAFGDHSCAKHINSLPLVAAPSHLPLHRGPCGKPDATNENVAHLALEHPDSESEFPTGGVEGELFLNTWLLLPKTKSFAVSQARFGHRTLWPAMLLKVNDSSSCFTECVGACASRLGQA